MAKKKRNKKRPPRNRQKRGGLPGGADMQNLMRQAQKLQEEMMEAQEDISDQEFEYTAGGEMVRVKVSGEKELLELKIKKEVIDPDDPELLEDLIIAAINGAMNEVDAYSEDQMDQFNLPTGVF